MITCATSSPYQQDCSWWRKEEKDLFSDGKIDCSHRASIPRFPQLPHTSSLSPTPSSVDLPKAIQIWRPHIAARPQLSTRYLPVRRGTMTSRSILPSHLRNASSKLKLHPHVPLLHIHSSPKSHVHIHTYLLSPVYLCISASPITSAEP